jgi:hypothetical protein
MVGRIRHWSDGFYGVTNLVAAIPNEVDSLKGLHSVLINPSSQFPDHPGERQPEQWVAVYLLNCKRQLVELTMFTHAWSSRTALPFGSTSLETGASCVILVNCCRSLCSYSAI